MFEKKSKWKSNGGIIGSKAKLGCNGGKMVMNE
jgi:hypothetical protein